MPWGHNREQTRRNYKLVRTAPGQPQVYEHRVLAERALGRALPGDAVVHHYSGTALVICQDQSYHGLLHRRWRVIKAGGNPNTDKICKRCQQVKAQSEFGSNRSTHDGLQAGCRECQRAIDAQQSALRLSTITTPVTYGSETRQAACNASGKPTTYMNIAQAKRRAAAFTAAGYQVEILRQVIDPRPYLGSLFLVCLKS